MPGHLVTLAVLAVIQLAVQARGRLMTDKLQRVVLTPLASEALERLHPRGDHPEVAIPEALDGLRVNLELPRRRRVGTPCRVLAELGQPPGPRIRVRQLVGARLPERIELGDLDALCTALYSGLVPEMSKPTANVVNLR